MANNKLSQLVKVLLKMTNYTTAPITKELVFFINFILLDIIQNLINVLKINNNAFIFISQTSKWGFLLKNGASFPFIIFIPFLLSYSFSILFILIKKIIDKTYIIFKITIYILSFSLYSTNIFLLLNFKTPISPSILTFILETNTNESTDFISTFALGRMSIVSYFIILITITLVLFANKCYYFPYKSYKQKNVYSICILFIYIFPRSINASKKYCSLFNCESTDDIENWSDNFSPETNNYTNIICSFYTIQIARKALNIALNSTLKKTGEAYSPSNVTIILIIGESFNKHHSNLYGYKHNTNPFLFQELRNGNLFVFNNVVASFNSTSHVLRNLFSVNSIMENENWYNYPMFTSIFRKAKFNVYFWDNQYAKTAGGISDYNVNSYIHNKKLDNIIYTKCNDQSYKYDLDCINSFYKTVKTKTNKELIIFHLRGQHIKAENSYPHDSKFSVFSIDSIRGQYNEFQKKDIAYYDNSTLYNDYVIENIMNRYRKSNAVIVYLSDHGEEIHDFRDRYGRTDEAMTNSNILKCQYEIPFMIWCSDLYIKQYNKKINNIKLSLNKPFMNDNVCQLLFDLCDIETRYYKSYRDLINPAFKAYKHRIVQGKFDYDVIMKKTK